MPAHKKRKRNAATRAMKRNSGLAGRAARKLGGRAAQLRAMEEAAMAPVRKKKRKR